MKWIFSLVLLHFANFIFAQNSDYKRIYPWMDSTRYVSDSLDVFNTYKLDDLKFMIGLNKKKSEDAGLKMIIKNKNNKVVYEKMSMIDSDIFRPNFFKRAKHSDTLLILAEEGREYSWGANAFLIIKENVKWIGHIDVASQDTVLDNPDSIIPNIKITSGKGKIVFKFEVEKLVYNPGGKDEIINGSELIYEYEDTLKMIKKK